jgi:hypothetical protein
MPTVSKVATLSVSETFAIGAENVVSKGKITASLVSIISFRYASLYKADETPSTDRNSDAVIIVGISSSLKLLGERSGATAPP